jgi:hypothetical protein
MLKKIVFIGLVAGLFSACVGVDPAGRGYSVTVPMSMINSTLAEKFPVDEKVSYGMVSGTLNISKPNVLGKEGSDKLGVGTSFKFTNMFIPKGIFGTIDLASGLRYDANTKSLYLANPMVNEIKFQNFSLSKYMTKDIQNAIGMVIAETISKKPVYNLKKAGVGANFVKGIDINNGQINLILGL